VPPTETDHDTDFDQDALFQAEDPGNLSDSIIAFPMQMLDAMTSATDDALVSRLRTADGDVLEDVDLRELHIEKTSTSGRFLVRVRGATHHSALAAGVVVTGGALIAAAMALRHKRSVRSAK
jgi:hypothetical protein